MGHKYIHMFVSPKLSAINVLTNKIVHVGFLCVLETQYILHDLLLSVKQQGTTISAQCPFPFCFVLCRLLVKQCLPRLTLLVLH